MLTDDGFLLPAVNIDKANKSENWGNIFFKWIHHYVLSSPAFPALHQMEYVIEKGGYPFPQKDSLWWKSQEQHSENH